MQFSRKLLWYHSCQREPSAATKKCNTRISVSRNLHLNASVKCIFVRRINKKKNASHKATIHLSCLSQKVCICVCVYLWLSLGRTTPPDQHNYRVVVIVAVFNLMGLRSWFLLLLYFPAQIPDGDNWFELPRTVYSNMVTLSCQVTPEHFVYKPELPP